MGKIFIGLLALALLYNNSAYAKKILHTINFEDHPGNISARGCCGFGYDLGVIYLPWVNEFNIVDMETFKRPHEYSGSFWDEENGLIYTCNGGFIDTAHMRDAIDQVAWVAQYMRTGFKTGRVIEFPNEATDSIKLFIYRQRGKVSDYAIAHTAARVVYEYLAWHEITTWYDYSAVPIYSQRHSAFSIEDFYSNLLGATIGAKVLLREGDYETIVNEEIKKALHELAPVTIAATKKALDKVEGVNKWWDRENTMTPNDLLLRRRNMDFTSVIQPWQVKDLAACKGRMNMFGTQPLMVPRSAGSRLLANLYSLEFDVDKDEVPIPMPRGREHLSKINSDYFYSLISELKRRAIRKYGKRYVTPDY